MYIYCDRPSRSARQLSRTLKIKLLREGATFNLPATVINWGSSKFYVTGRDRFKVLNPPEAVRKAADKLLFFQAMEGSGLTPRFYTTSAEASKAISNGKAIVCRTVLNGHSGNGIVLANDTASIVPAKLYVEYIKKETEWRVHVFNGEVIDIQRKARDKSVPDDKMNWSIRNHQNGFIYMRGDVDKYGEKFVKEMCIKALDTIQKIGLDFGAVDIIATKAGKMYILEVNTAPGLEGTTLENYINAIRKVM